MKNVSVLILRRTDTDVFGRMNLAAQHALLVFNVRRKGILTPVGNSRIMSFRQCLPLLGVVATKVAVSRARSTGGLRVPSKEKKMAGEFFFRGPCGKTESILRVRNVRGGGGREEKGLFREGFGAGRGGFGAGKEGGERERGGFLGIGFGFGKIGPKNLRGSGAPFG